MADWLPSFSSLFGGADPLRARAMEVLGREPYGPPASAAAPPSDPLRARVLEATRQGPPLAPQPLLESPAAAAARPAAPWWGSGAEGLRNRVLEATQRLPYGPPASAAPAAAPAAAQAAAPAAASEAAGLSRFLPSFGTVARGAVRYSLPAGIAAAGASEVLGSGDTGQYLDSVGRAVRSDVAAGNYGAAAGRALGGTVMGTGRALAGGLGGVFGAALNPTAAPAAPAAAPPRTSTPDTQPTRAPYGPEDWLRDTQGMTARQMRNAIAQIPAPIRQTGRDRIIQDLMQSSLANVHAAYARSPEEGQKAAENRNSLLIRLLNPNGFDALADFARQAQD